jgi:hypothetical protein
MSSIAYQRISGNNNGSALAGLPAPLPVKVGNNTVANVDAGGLVVPASVNPSTLYWVNDFIDYATGVLTNGVNGSQANNGITAPLVTGSNIGVIYAGTSSATAGGSIATASQIPVIKSTAITYQWRWIFRMPAASTAANRFVAYVGGINTTGTMNTTNLGPVASGPFLKYSDNLNSGNWVIGSATSTVQVTANTSTAPSFNAWSTCVCTLVNGTYTFAVNGVTIGSVLDTNMATSPSLNQGSSLGGVAILPDAAGFTTPAYVLMDRADLYVTGLTR